MATYAEKKSQTASMKALKGGAMGYETAARKYVNEGLGKLGLKPNEQTALRKKLIPIIARQMGSDRSRTATRAKGIVNRETKARLKKANQL
jgi:hypothetical protein